MTLPIWRLTRTSFGHWVFDTLASAGMMFSRLEQFEHTLGGPLPNPSVPDEISLRVEAPETVTLTGRMDRSELSDRDRIVVAVADECVVGVQPVTVDRPFYVEPLKRAIDFDGAYFWGLYVTPEWRRRGIATALVARALSFVANKTSQTHVQTLVGIDNAPSKRVLTGMGFKRKRTRSYYQVFGFQRRGQP